MSPTSKLSHKNVHRIVSKVVPQIDRKIVPPKLLPKLSLKLSPTLTSKLSTKLSAELSQKSQEKRLKRPKPDRMRARKKEGHYNCHLKPYSIEHRIQFSLVTFCVIFFLGCGRGEHFIFVIIISKRRGRG